MPHGMEGAAGIESACLLPVGFKRICRPVGTEAKHICLITTLKAATYRMVASTICNTGGWGARLVQCIVCRVG